jgi:hypothetical protein
MEATATALMVCFSNSHSNSTCSLTIAGRQFYCCPIPEVAAGGGINCGWKDTCSDDQEPLTFAGTFLEAVSDVLDYTGLFGQALADFLDDVDMDNMRQYCCSKEEIKNWKDCYWAVCFVLYPPSECLWLTI